MVLNMKAISNYNDIKNRKMPAKRLKIYSDHSSSGKSSMIPQTALISRNSEGNQIVDAFGDSSQQSGDIGMFYNKSINLEKDKECIWTV